MLCTTFNSVHNLFASNFRFAECLRSAQSIEVIDEFTIRNRSNYTRVDSGNTWGWVADLECGGLRIAHDRGENLAYVTSRSLDNDTQVGCTYSPDELRKMAYTMLAAANSIDTRDSEAKQRLRRPGATPVRYFP
jgi:Golgi nucleoside diphosphatase